MNDSVTKFLNELDPISLKEMDKVALMNRTDTKFIFSVSTLIDVLSKLKKHYYSLEINGIRAANYKTLYFDTEKILQLTSIKSFYRVSSVVSYAHSLKH